MSMTRSSFRNIIIGTCVLIILFLMFLKPEAPVIQQKPHPTVPFCTIMPSSVDYIENIAIGLIGDSALYWKKRNLLRVYFFNGSLDIQNEVMNIVNEWASTTSLKFEHVYDEFDSSEVRVCFTCPGYNSTIGTQSYDSAFAFKPTMCLEGLDTIADKKIFKRTVLHEFGHVLGFLHELQNPTAKIPWDTAKLYRYYDSVYKWKPDSVKKWVLDLYNGVDGTDFDPQSIMVYEVPEEVTKGTFSISWPNKLSKTDKTKAHQIYH